MSSTLLLIGLQTLFVGLIQSGKEHLKISINHEDENFELTNLKEMLSGDQDKLLIWRMKVNAEKRFSNIHDELNTTNFTFVGAISRRTVN
jgi:hypothetical protein